MSLIPNSEAGRLSVRRCEHGRTQESAPAGPVVPRRCIADPGLEVLNLVLDRQPPTPTDRARPVLTPVCAGKDRARTASADHTGESQSHSACWPGGSATPASSAGFQRSRANETAGRRLPCQRAGRVLDRPRVASKGSRWARMRSSRRRRWNRNRQRRECCAMRSVPEDFAHVSMPVQFKDGRGAQLEPRLGPTTEATGESSSTAPVTMADAVNANASRRRLGLVGRGSGRVGTGGSAPSRLDRRAARDTRFPPWRGRDQMRGRDG